jgi:ADP-heptose:LPS heptosyltransferase
MIAEERQVWATPSEEVFELAYNFRYEDALMGFVLALNSGGDIKQYCNAYSLHGVVRGAYLRIMTGTPSAGTVGTAVLDAAAVAYGELELLGTREGFSAEYFKAAHMLSGMLIRAGRSKKAAAVINEAFENGAARNPYVRIALLLLRIQLLRSSRQHDAAFDLAESLVARPFQIIDAGQIAELNILYGHLCKETGRLDAFQFVMWRGLRITRGNSGLRNRTLDALVEIYGSRKTVDAHADPGSVEETVLRLAWAAHSQLNDCQGRETAANLADRIDAYLERHNYTGPRAQHGVHFNGPALRIGIGHRILVTRGVGGIGDLLMMTPGIRALRAMNPQSEIVFAVPGYLVALLNGNPHCKVVDIATEGLDVRDFDAWYNLSDCPASRHESRTAPKVTLSRIELFAEGMGVEPSDLECSGRQPVYVVSDDERKFARNFLSDKGSGPFVAVQLQAADRYRDYPHLETVVKSLSEHCDVLVFGDRPFSGFDYDRVTRVHGLDLRLAFAIVSQCDVVVAPDSSFIHLAGALNLACVALFGPIDGRMRTQDYPRCVTLDAADIHPCMPCWRDELTKCRVTDGRRSQCMADIDPRKVIQTTLSLKETDNADPDCRSHQSS